MPTKRYHAAGAKRILIVEDIESNYLLVDALLRRNYRLTWVRTGKDALEMVDKEEFDLILMDMRLPVMDGFTATQRLRELYPDLPVIAMSAFAMDKDIQKAMQAGCSDYLVKPISKQRLLSAIERHLGVIR